MPPLPSWINVFRYVLPVVLYKSHSEASDCTPLQITGCKQSARDGTLSSLTGGGECQARPYSDIYSHLCTVTDYEPTTDFCCCAQNQNVMCCRYHNSWDVFRCIEADDTIDTLPANPLTQEVLFTIILVPTAAVICCVICCVRYVCCCDENEGAMCGCNKYGGHQYGEQYVTSCKKSGDDSGHSGSKTSSNGSARSAHELSSNQITPPIPSAPPEEDLIISAPPTPPQIAEVLLPKVTLQDKILPGHEAAVHKPQSALLIVHSDSDIVQNIPVTLVQNMYPEHRYVRSISNDYPRNFNNITYQPLQRSLSVANGSVPNCVVANNNPKIPNVCSTFVLPEGPPPMYKDI